MNTTSETKTRSRYFMPLVLATLSLLFVFLVIYQVKSGTTPKSDRPHLPSVAELFPDRSDGTEPKAGDESDDGAVTSSGEVAEADRDELETIQEWLKEYFDFLRFDPDRYRENGPLIAQMIAELEEFLAGLPPEAVPLLLDLLDTEEDFVLRRKILYGLGAIGSAPAAMGIAEYYHTLLLAENEKDSEISHTIRALGEVDTDLSFDLLQDFIKGAGEHKHRYKFVEALGNHSDRASAVPIFTDLLTSDVHFKVRNNAAQALKKAAVVASAPDVEHALRSEENKYVRQTMMGALGDIGDTGSVRTLETIARNDKDPVNRLSAVSAITKIGGPAAKPILEDIAAKDSHDRVRYYAQKGVTTLERQGW